jgi:hypothetical protein
MQYKWSFHYIGESKGGIKCRRLPDIGHRYTCMLKAVDDKVYGLFHVQDYYGSVKNFTIIKIINEITALISNTTWK